MQGKELIDAPLGFYNGFGYISLGDVSSGLYFVQIEADGLVVHTEKVNVLR